MVCREQLEGVYVVCCKQWKGVCGVMLATGGCAWCAVSN